MPIRITSCISLPPDLVASAKVVAQENGDGNLSRVVQDALKVYFLTRGTVRP